MTTFKNSNLFSGFMALIPFTRPLTQEFIRGMTCSMNPSENDLISILKSAHFSIHSLEETGKARGGAFMKCYPLLEPVDYWLAKVMANLGPVPEIATVTEHLLTPHRIMEQYLRGTQSYIPESTYLEIEGSIGNPIIAEKFLRMGKLRLFFQEYIHDGITLAKAKENWGTDVPTWFREQLSEFLYLCDALYSNNGFYPQISNPYSDSLLVSNQRRKIYLVDTNAPFRDNDLIKYTSEIKHMFDL
jgi:hypothetical protein